MTFWTETAIAKHLDGRFYQLQQMSLGKFRVIDLNEPDEPEPTAPSTRWTEQELVYLIELKRDGKTHAQCAELLNRTQAAIMDKWQNRLEWGQGLKPPLEGALRLNDIIRVVCAVYGISRTDLISHRRTHCCVAPRHVYFWLARQYTSFSLPQIGGACGGRDHSTVLHGISRIEQQMDLFRTKIELCVFDLGLSLPQQEAA